MKKIDCIQNIAKGILICSVIFFHSKIFIDYSIINNFNILFLIFPCLIGVFFFYSGYNYNPEKRTPKESIIKRTKQLLLDRGIQPPPIARELLDRLFLSYHVNKEHLYESMRDDESKGKEFIVAIPIEQKVDQAKTSSASQYTEPAYMPVNLSQLGLIYESQSQSQC